MSRFIRSRAGVVVRHHQLEGDNQRLMRTDCVHLNEDGLNIFLSGLQDGVEQALFLLGGVGALVGNFMVDGHSRGKSNNINTTN